MRSASSSTGRFARLGRSTPAVLLSAMLVLGGCSREGPAEEVDAANADASTPSNIAAPGSQAAAGEWPGRGNYGCAESIPRLVNGSYEYSSEGRGFLTVDGRGGRRGELRSSEGSPTGPTNRNA